MKYTRQSPYPKEPFVLESSSLHLWLLDHNIFTCDTQTQFTKTIRNKCQTIFGNTSNQRKLKSLGFIGEMTYTLKSPLNP